MPAPPMTYNPAWGAITVLKAPLQIASKLRCVGALLFATALFQDARAQLDNTSFTSEIRIVSPTDGTRFEAKANVPLRIQGMDVPDVGHVIRVLENGMVLRSLVLDPLVPIQTQPVAFDLTFDADDLRAGRYTFVAMIDDVSSAPVTIVVRRHRGRHH